MHLEPYHQLNFWAKLIMKTSTNLTTNKPINLSTNKYVAVVYSCSSRLVSLITRDGSCSVWLSTYLQRNYQRQQVKPYFSTIALDITSS